MDKDEAEALRQRLETLIRDRWSAQDPDVHVSSLMRSDNKIDVQVISDLFEGKDGLERESFFWPVFDPVPKSDLVYMTYCLLLTPREAARNFAAVGDKDESNRDRWD